MAQCHPCVQFDNVNGIYWGKNDTEVAAVFAKEQGKWSMDGTPQAPGLAERPG